MWRKEKSDKVRSESIVTNSYAFLEKHPHATMLLEEPPLLARKLLMYMANKQKRSVPAVHVIIDFQYMVVMEITNVGAAMLSIMP